MINFGLKPREALFKDTEKELLSAFYAGGTTKSNKEFHFAKVDSNFVNFLPYLNDGAVRLYLYYAIFAKNETGESWHSMDTISKKLKTTERSINNWNHQLEDLGLIFRTNSGKRSKTTFVLPLTGFAVKMSTQKMDQMLTELNLFSASEYSKIFGKFQSVMRLYVRNRDKNTITEILCIHLRRESKVKNTVLNSVDTYVFDVVQPIDEAVAEKLSGCEISKPIAVVEGGEGISLGGKALTPRCFLIDDSSGLTESDVYEAMRQLTQEDPDFSTVERISIQEQGGKK